MMTEEETISCDVIMTAVKEVSVWPDFRTMFVIRHHLWQIFNAPPNALNYIASKKYIDVTLSVDVPGLT